MNYSAQDLIEKLGLEPHQEGGWYRFIGKGGIRIAKSTLPAEYSGDRSCVSTIYYFLKEDEFSRWHKLHSEEIWTWHYGSSLIMTLGGTGDRPVPERTLRIGPDLEKGDRFQITVPAFQWQETRLADGGFALVSCIVSPGYEDADCYLPEPETIREWGL